MAGNLLYHPRALVLFVVPLLLAFGSSSYIFLLLSFALFRNWEAFADLLHFSINLTVIIDFAKAGAALFTLLQIARFFVGLKEPSSPSDAFPTKPMIFPCRTNHTRLYPKTHCFSYSYLWVGVPVGWKGSVGGMLSADDTRPMNLLPWYMRHLSLNSRSAWYTVNGDDFLGRGHVDGGLEEKLQKYLQSQGIDHTDYPYAYLLTAPSFLGYVSNPISVWNLYSKSKELKAFILEVNNTFDERHTYLIKPALVPSTSLDPETPPKLVNTWTKDFYLSTFETKAGNYSISATDPLFPSMSSAGVVNTTISLKSAHTRFVARIYSVGPAIDPASMSVWEKMKFLAAWWWVGLATFLRTGFQALALLLKRKMTWVFRPEPGRKSMPRHADAAEIVVERVFRKYLRHLVEKCGYPVIVEYSPAGIVHGKNEIMAAHAHRDAEILEFKVLTPSFYSRLLHYSEISFGEALIAENESATIALSSLDLLSKLANNTLPIQQPAFNIVTNHRPWAIQTLRKKLLPIQGVASSAPASHATAEMKIPYTTPTKQAVTVQLSPLESYVLTECSIEERSEYASRVLKMFISEYIAFGWMDLLDLEIFLIRTCVAWVVSGLLDYR